MANVSHFMTRLKIKNFQCSEGRVCHFKMFKSISMHKVSGELAAVDPYVMEN
jgi:hypothetical protein